MHHLGLLLPALALVLVLLALARHRANRSEQCLLVTSSGGHLLQLCQLRDVWPAEERQWVTFDRPDARSLLDGERVTYAHHPTNRNVPNLLRNLVLACRLVWTVRPATIASTGAGVGVPFCIAGWLLGAQVVYIESFTRITEPSLTGRLVHPFADHFFVQWPEMLKHYRRAQFVGSLFDMTDPEGQAA